MADAGWILGIDVGGTYTDIELIDLSTGRVHRHKISSTPADPSRAVAQGMREVIELAGINPAAIRYFSHGTTVATNALVQSHTARTGLVTTKGFRDVLDIRRQRQPHVYDMTVPKPPSPVPRRWRMEVNERLYLFGRESVPPAKEEVARIAKRFQSEGVEAVAVCFLHSYHNPGHERLVAKWLREAVPGIYVCASSDVLREFREYERMSTTVLNASLGPVMEVYLQQIERDAQVNELSVIPQILQSNGGVVPPSEASRFPVRTLASGPAAGVMGAIRIAARLEESNIITFDVGGTTADICLVEQGKALVGSEREFGGYPVRFPMVDVLSIGAGGGSVAWLDPGGFLHVGPQSAGADPGPVCYGKGGLEPTVTDANLVLGRLNPAGLLGGRMAVDVDSARCALARKIAEPMGISVEEAAVGVLRILNENMVHAVRVISVERGHDPREFALVAFGGAGPLLAGRLAAELDMRRIVIPRSPGLLCAEGLLVADIRSDFALTRIMELTEAGQAKIESTLAGLQSEASAWFEREGIAPTRRSFHYSIDMRYKGQSHELRIPVARREGRSLDVNDLECGFVDEHMRLFGFASERAIELVTFRVAAMAGTYLHPPEPQAGPMREGGSLLHCRDVYFEESGGWCACEIHDRAMLGPSAEVEGPAVLEQMDTTIVVAPMQRALVQPTGDIVLYLSGADRKSDG